MSDIKSLQEELKYYTRLLSEHKSKIRTFNQHKTWEKPQNLHKRSWIANENAKQQKTYLKRCFSSNSSYRSLHKYTNQDGTVLSSQTPKLIVNKLSETKNSFDIISNRTLLKNDCKKERNFKNINEKYTNLSPNFSKKALMEEIATLTLQLKQKSMLNSKISEKKNENVKNAIMPKRECKVKNKMSSDTEKVTLAKFNNAVSNSQMSEKNHAAQRKTSVKSMLNTVKFETQKPFVLVKSSENDRKAMQWQSNFDVNTKKLLSNPDSVSNNLFEKKVPKISVSPFKTSKFQSEYILASRKRTYVKKLDKQEKVDVLKNAVLNKLPSMYKVSHTKVNKKYTLNKNQNINKNFHKSMTGKTKLGNRKSKNLNSTYKIVNKATPYSVKRKLKLHKQNFNTSKENSLIFNKSDPLFELLQESAATDKLEQELFAKNTLTVTPEFQSNKLLVNNKQSSSKKVFKSRYKLKKLPIKKSKLSTQYSIFSKSSDCTKNITPKKKGNLFKNSNIKRNKIASKHFLINKQNITPIFKKKPVHMERVFKSKNTIINKNETPVSYSAKMIKSKYFSVNRVKSTWQICNPRKPFRGHYMSSSPYLKPNKYRSTQPTSYSQKMKRFSNYRRSVLNVHCSRGLKNKYSKHKSRKGYTNKSPILLIKGVRYSLSSSGKTLTKLPSKDQIRSNKTPKKVLIHGKYYIRTSENVMKAASPTSTNLASRVLNRSISTALNASTKKKLTKVNTYCMFYNRFGRCNRGVKCTYIHDPSKIAVCTRFLRGTCKVDKCPFSHEISPGKMAICSYFLVGACENSNCPYRHDELSSDIEPCKAFIQGYCPNGKECKKAHILICPKFIQGTCEKGSSCAYPHPPRKVKKNVQKEVVVDENEKKEGDALLEKVARYFQPSDEELHLQCRNTDEINTVKVFVRRQKRLEEQPSFIPLLNS